MSRPKIIGLKTSRTVLTSVVITDRHPSLFESSVKATDPLFHFSAGPMQVCDELPEHQVLREEWKKLMSATSTVRNPQMRTEIFATGTKQFWLTRMLSEYCCCVGILSTILVI